MAMTPPKEPRPPLSARPGAEVPGYSGYIGGKMPEADVLGGTFRETNEQAAMRDANRKAGQSGRTAPGEQLAPAAAAEAWSPRRAPALEGTMTWTPRSGNGAVPGYQGHLPGKVEDVYGATFSASNHHAGTERLGEVRVGEAVPGPAPAPGSDPLVRTPQRRERGGEPQKGTGFATKAIPGYVGHVPGKSAENIIGVTWQPANALAADEFSAMARGQRACMWRRCSGPGVESRRRSGAALGHQVPGYTGYVGGKLPDTEVCGKTFRVANETADQLHKEQRGRHPPRQREAAGGRPASAPLASSSGRSGRSGKSGSRAASSCRGSTITGRSNATGASKTSQSTRQSRAGSTGGTPGAGKAKQGRAGPAGRPKQPVSAARPGFLDQKGHIPGYSGHVPNHLRR